MITSVAVESPTEGRYLYDAMNRVTDCGALVLQIPPRPP